MRQKDSATNSRSRQLLVVVPLSKEVPTQLLDKAALVARKVGLDVLVYSPAVTATEGTDDAQSASPAATEETLELPKRLAEDTVSVLVERGIAASSYYDSPRSALQGTARLAERAAPRLIMLLAQDYVDWTKMALSDRDVLDRSGIPVWLANSGTADGLVLAALAAGSTSTHGSSGLDDEIASQASELAGKLDSPVHALHVVDPQSSLRHVVDTVLPSEKTDAARQRVDDDHVAAANAIASRHLIPKEHVHIHYGDFPEVTQDFVSSIPVSLIVTGPDQRISLFRALSESTQQQLAMRLSSDLLIVHPTQNASARAS